MHRTDIKDPDIVRQIEKGLNYKQIFDDTAPTVVTGEHEEAGCLVLVYLPDKVVLISDLTNHHRVDSAIELKTG
jgi:hypothetical protein